MLKNISFITILICVAISRAFASEVIFEKEVGWASFRDITNSEYYDKLEKYQRLNYIMTNLSAYETSSGLRYSMIWKKNTENKDWAQIIDLKLPEFELLNRIYNNNGYRMVDIESYLNNGRQFYAAIWIKSTDAITSTIFCDLTLGQYRANYLLQVASGNRLIDFEAYKTKNGLRYTAIWLRNDAGVQWKQEYGLTRAEYQQKIEKSTAEGYVVTDYQTYLLNQVQLYGFISEKRSGYAIAVRTNRTALEFANYWREYSDQGFRLIDFECHNTNTGKVYGGVWIEDYSSRYRYDKKKSLDSLINLYYVTNNIPGISAVAIQDGKIIYQRGFGFADKEAGKVAHGETVYLAASLSKVIGGTIAVKLHSEQRLRSGEAVNFNLYNTTRSYLTNVRNSRNELKTLPSGHTHTVAQLCAHLACLRGYPDVNGGPANLTSHCKQAIDALPQIWNLSNTFLNNCTMGDNSSYSTFGFTYLAAVLEKVTGKRSAELIQTEIAVPYNLNTMRCQFATDDGHLPYNYDRAKPYGNNGSATNYQDNSWKVFGGGIELSTVDLAKFGWKVLDGQIVDAAARDNIMWTRVNPSEPYGIAWKLTNNNIAEHGGSWSGARCHLKLYRRSNIVIAIMTNKTDHPIESLPDQMRDIILL